MNAAVLSPFARRNDDGHYTWDGVKHPSVTTILSSMGGAALMPWYAKMAATECADIVSRKLEGFITQKECDDQILDWQTRMTAAIRYRDYKAAIGSLTHHAIYEWALGVRVDDMLGYLTSQAVSLGLDTKDDRAEIEPYAVTLAKAARHYVAGALAWINENKPDFEAVGQEAVIVSETHGYAGTTDAIATVKGRRLHLDFKTSTSLDEKKFRMQIEAYRRADFIGLMADGSQHEIPPTDAVGVLWIRPVDPTVLKTWEPSDEYFEGFLAARQVYGVMHEMPKPNARKRATPKPVRGEVPF